MPLAAPPMMKAERHYGMDWLRIGAFAILIVYHIGMVFVPWGFHAKAVHTLDWVTIPMLLVSPWRLTLLFLVSGYATRALLKRTSGIGPFVRGRSARLLVPLLFGVLVIVPPQPWVELVMQHGYGEGFGRFLATAYLRFGAIEGVVLPNWNHLWFVGYLWIYTLALAALAYLPGLARVQRVFDRTFGDWRALVLPLLWLFATQIVLFTRWTDTHDVIGDGVAHLAFFPAFLFGFGLAGSPRVMAALVRLWQPAAVMALGGYLVAAVTQLLWPGMATPPAWVGEALLWARQVQCWAAIVALIGLAERYLNRDQPWRARLTEAVFPCYLLHQTVIVVVAYWLAPIGLPSGGQFAVLLATTVGACWAFYAIGREIGWLRPLIGLRRHARPARQLALEPALI